MKRLDGGEPLTEAAAKNGPANCRVRKFNPGTLQSDREVIEQFVVRSHELDVVIETLRGNIEASSCQHVLVVAPRGRGKTMLLARAAAQLRTDDALSARLLPVVLMEESLEISNAADFWLETLFHLARACAPHDPEIARELRKSHADLAARWRERGLHELARAAVLDAADRLERKLVLVVENLQSLCESVDRDFGWQLRAALQSDPQVMLLASATSRFSGLENAEEPFFELFRIVDLQPLGTADCRRLWHAVSGDAVAERDVRPLQILTGGNPRLLVIVAGFSRHWSLRRLMEELVTLIDEHTEYFRGHLDVLPKGERRVYVAVIDLWRPSTAGEVAERARMGVRTVSTMLGRLVHRGAVVLAPGSEDRKRLYMSAEPLFSIYFKLRRERDEATVVENLITFMAMFYNWHELFPMLDQFRAEVEGLGAEAAAINERIDHALGNALHIECVGSRSGRALLEDLSETMAKHYRSKAEAHLRESIESAIGMHDWQRAIETVDRFVEDDRNAAAVDSDILSSYLAHVRVVAHFQMGDLERVIAVGNEAVKRFQDSRHMYPLYRSATILLHLGKAHLNRKEYSSAISSFSAIVERFSEREESVFRGLRAQALAFRAAGESELGNIGAAVASLDEILDRFEDCRTLEVQDSIYRAILSIMTDPWSKPEHAEVILAAYDRVSDWLSRSHTRVMKGMVSVALLTWAFERERNDDLEGELRRLQDVIDRFGDEDEDADVVHAVVTLALWQAGMRRAEIGRVEGAWRAHEALEERSGDVAGKPDDYCDWMAWCVRTMALMAQDERDAAMEGFRATFRATGPRDEVTMEGLLRLVLQFLSAGVRDRDLLDVLESDDEDDIGSFLPLVVALRERSGETVRAPVEVLQVAGDIRKRIEERVEKGLGAACA